MIRRDNKAAKRKRQYRARAKRRMQEAHRRIRSHYPHTIEGMHRANGRIMMKVLNRETPEFSWLLEYPGDASEPTLDNAGNGTGAGATR